jgi:hypothetical protein
MVYGAPAPGFSTPEEGGVREAGGRLSGIFFALFAELWQRAPFPIPSDEEITPALRRQLEVVSELADLGRVIGLTKIGHA